MAFFVLFVSLRLILSERFPPNPFQPVPPHLQRNQTSQIAFCIAVCRQL